VAPWLASPEQAGQRLRGAFLDGAWSYGGGAGQQTFLGCSCEAGLAGVRRVTARFFPRARQRLLVAPVVLWPQGDLLRRRWALGKFFRWSAWQGRLWVGSTTAAAMQRQWLGILWTKRSPGGGGVVYIGENIRCVEGGLPNR
jgi:hypothetical protein